MDKINFLKLKTNEIRKNVLKMIYNAKAGHIGGSLSSVDILTVLFYEIMKIDKDCKNDDIENDEFILSKGHSVESYYAVLSDLGFFDEKELNNYCKYNSNLYGHPTNKVNGIKVNTGSLGHGLSIGVGMAIANKLNENKGKVFVLLGDGELDEGSNWEAAMAASYFKLDNLVAIIDRNRLQISGSTEDVMALEPLNEKFKAFGWNVKEVDGHNIEELINVFRNIPFECNRPNLIIANTIKGKGISFIENNPKWHHGVPSEEQYVMALKELEDYK